MAKNELEVLKAQLAAAKAENEALKKTKAGKLTLKVSEKGGVSLYGVGRFPATFYKEQWEIILAAGPRIQEFINSNIDSLATAEDKAERQEAAKLAEVEKKKAA